MSEQDMKVGLHLSALRAWARGEGLNFVRDGKEQYQYHGTVIDPSSYGVDIYLEDKTRFETRPENMSPVADMPPQLRLEVIRMAKGNGPTLTLLAGIDDDGVLHYCDVAYRDRS